MLAGIGKVFLLFRTCKTLVFSAKFILTPDHGMNDAFYGKRFHNSQNSQIEKETSHRDTRNNGITG
jgi:hypothetical protein